MPDFWLYGDIKLTDHQKALLDVPVGANDFIQQRKPPAATREKTLLWEGGVIPYVFDCSMSKLAPQRIKICPPHAFCVEKLVISYYFKMTELNSIHSIWPLFVKSG